MLSKVVAALIAFGPWGVFLLGFIDSLGIPLPATMDALLVLVAVKAPQRAYFTALMGVLGSTGGSISLFWAVRHGRRLFLKGEPPPGKRQRFERWFDRYGMLTVFIPAVTPVLPLPLKVFVVSAGALKTPFSKFLGVILLGRVIRYFGEAYLGIQLGEEAQTFLARHAWTILGIALALAGAAYVLIRMSDRRRETAV
ncbi:MAG: VTT domain-containing protein [Bryobacteraceae bacterium]